jgi:hypothetical protein
VSYVAPELVDDVDASLPVEEFVRRIRAPVDPEEEAETVALIRWFVRRYPTPKERLAFARRMFAQWTRPTSIVRRGPP